MKNKFWQISLPIITGLFVLTSLAAHIVLAWEKSGDITCQNVFAKIKNDNQYRYSDSSDGYVKYVRTETDGDGNSDWEWRVGPIEGDVSNNVWVEVNWTPPAGFSGDVEVLAAIYEDKSPSSQTWDDTGDFEDYKKVTKHLNCPAASPSPSPSPSPDPSPEPSPSPSPNDDCEGVSCNTGDPSPSPSPSPEATPSASPDPSPSSGGSSSSDSSSSSSSSSNSSTGGQVLGTNTLASTGSAPQAIMLLGLILMGAGVWQLAN